MPNPLSTNTCKIVVKTVTNAIVPYASGANILAKTIETIGYKVPELNDDAKKIIGLFSSNKKLLKNGK